MITVQVHHILKNPTTEKLIDLIESENINNLPLFIYTVTNSQVNPSTELYEFKHKDNNYYFFAQSVRKTLSYNTDMLPDLTDCHTVFISNLLA